MNGNSISGRNIMNSLINNPYFVLLNPLSQRQTKVVFLEILSDHRLTCLMQTIIDYSQDLWKHSLNVMMLTIMMAKESLYGPVFIHDIAVGGLFHDLGKTYIPFDIFSKPFKLTQDEFNTMSLHPQFGYYLLKDIGFSELSLEMVRFHHYNSGYPIGSPVVGNLEHIHIIELSDAYDAMTCTRPYQRCKSSKEAIREIEVHIGCQFDEGFSKLFIELIRREKFGRTIMQNTSR